MVLRSPGFLFTVWIPDVLLKKPANQKWQLAQTKKVPQKTTHSSHGDGKRAAWQDGKFVDNYRSVPAKYHAVNSAHYPHQQRWKGSLDFHSPQAVMKHPNLPHPPSKLYQRRPDRESGTLSLPSLPRWSGGRGDTVEWALAAPISGNENMIQTMMPVESVWGAVMKFTCPSQGGVSSDQWRVRIPILPSSNEKSLPWMSTKSEQRT